MLCDGHPPTVRDTRAAWRGVADDPTLRRMRMKSATYRSKVPMTQYDILRYQPRRPVYSATIRTLRLRGAYVTGRDEVPKAFEMTREGLAALFDHVDEVVFCCEADGTIRFVSQACRSLMGYDPITMVGRNLIDFVHPDDIGRVIDVIARWSGRPGRPLGRSVTIVTSDGTAREMTYDAAIGDQFGSIGSLVVTLRPAGPDTTASRSLRAASLNGDRILRIASAFLHVDFDGFSDGLDVTLSELVGLERVTRASIWQFEDGRALLRGQWTATVNPPTLPLAPRIRIEDFGFLRDIAAGNEVHLGEPWSHGEEYARERQIFLDAGVTWTMAVPMSSAGSVTGMLAIESTLDSGAFDATHATTLRSASAIVAGAFVRHEDERRLAEQARTDRVTGLANRWAFDEALERALGKVADGTSPGFGVAMLDLDHFKIVNDSLGHVVGDRLLADVAVRLVGAMADHTLIARLGGDEMLLLFDESDSVTSTFTSARKLAKSLATPFDVAGTASVVTASIGVVHQSDANTTAGELLQLIDLATERAKSLGGDTIEVDDPANRLGQSSKMRRIAELRQAIANDEFEVHYQGEWDLDSGGLVGAEALVRWAHPDEGLLVAADFVPLAEAAGLITELGNAVLTTACRTAAPWVEAFGEHEFVLRVNVAAQELQKGDLVDRVSDALADSGLPPTALCIELTESTLLADPIGSAVLFGHLRELGVGLAIDDFGTGYSSLLQLKRLPLTALKIDRAFVTGLPTDSNDRAIVEATLGLAATLGFSATAEGVETEEQRRALVELGCHRAQGYLLARPEAADVFSERVRRLAPH